MKFSANLQVQSILQIPPFCCNVLIEKTLNSHKIATTFAEFECLYSHVELQSYSTLSNRLSARIWVKKGYSVQVFHCVMSCGVVVTFA